MNFKSHRKQKSILVASSHRDREQRRSANRIKQSFAYVDPFQRAKQIYYSQQNLPQAVHLFNSFLEQHPQNNEALYLCGVACLHTNNTQQAIERLLRVSQDFNNHSNAMLLAAMAYNKLGYFSKSLELMDRCIQMYPFFEEGICFRGRLHLSLKNYHKSQLDFKCAIGFRKESYLSLLGLADCLKATNRSQKALEYYKKAKYTLLQEKNTKYNGQIDDIELKIGVCLYSMQKYDQSLKHMTLLAENPSMKISELYYYIGLCLLKLGSQQKSLLNLQYSIRLQTSSNITKKAYKKLIICYLKNYQFYESLNIVKLGEKCGIQLPQWKDTVQSFMIIIKGNYEQGANKLKEIINKMKTSEVQNLKNKKESFKELKSFKEPFKLKIMEKPKKINFAQSPKRKDSLGLVSHNRNMRKKSQFFNKSVQKAITKIGSVHNYKQAIRAPLELLRYKTQHVANDNLRSSKLSQDNTQAIFNEKQKQIVYPFILQFKAYSQFFLNNFIACIETYEEYQAYIKDMFGKQSGLDYNRLLCEAMLMSQTDMADDALSKFSEAVEFYFEKYGKLSPQPILYKTILLIRLAASKKDTESSQSQDEEIASFEQILESTLKMIQNYKQGIKDLPLSHFLEAIVFILQQNLQKARSCLQKTLKLTEQCNWKFLYVKGVIEMVLGNPYDAVKQFSAGLILQNRAQFYLCRSICFFELSQSENNQYSSQSLTSLMKSVSISAQLSGNKRSNLKGRLIGQNGDIFLQYCFQDLQSYIELQTDKNQISIWVSKILFATKSFEEAISSLEKISINNTEMFQLAKCIEVYEGEFEDGGNAGIVIKTAFDGTYLTTEEQGIILQKTSVKYYDSFAYDYLTNDFEKWLIILHIYVKSNYQLLLKYIQKELFSVENQKTEVLLRYNLCVLYLLLGDMTKTVNVAKSLLKYQKKYALQSVLQKLINGQYEQDECLGQLCKGAGIGANKLLSNYLPFQPVLVNLKDKSIRIYVRINVPFPKFPTPNLQVSIDRKFIIDHINADMIEKKIQAPWIHKINNQIIQFTQKLDESHSAAEQMSSKYQTPSEKTLGPIQHNENS